MPLANLGTMAGFSVDVDYKANGSITAVVVTVPPGGSGYVLVEMTDGARFEGTYTTTTRHALPAGAATFDVATDSVVGLGGVTMRVPA